jgi:pyruvate/2-oxoglutarate dehydrogenase complex dihydrolipoamide acyltransferase (E2) component
MTATLHTSKGDIKLNLFPDHAPKTVETIMGLAEGTIEWTHPKTGEKSSTALYNGTVFHRVIDGFMIQGGDPLGTGTGGRVTVEDLEGFLDYLEAWPSTHASSMRMAVADAMRRSWTRPLATVVLPVQLDTLLAHRKRQTIKAGPALYALRALALGLSEMPATAGRLIGDRLVHPRSIDIGFAVEAEDGVLVPVIRHAEQFPLADLVERYNRLVELARARRLPGSDTGGSIATITNYGVFGLTMATPIPLPEQTLLLGMGAGRITPSWDPEKKIFVPVTEAQFTLSFDHRVLDGGAAGRLLQRVAGLLGTPEEL